MLAMDLIIDDPVALEQEISMVSTEFAGELSKRGYPISITMGNAKSVDIYAESSAGVLKIDAKAGRAKGNWPIAKNTVKEDVHYVFVHLQTDKMIKNNVNPEYSVVSGKKILPEGLIDT